MRMPLIRDKWLLNASPDLVGADYARIGELPVAPHPGAFGVRRKNHIHEGMDLYGVPGEPVFAMADGVIDRIYPFTGPNAGSPWWLDTQAIFVRSVEFSLNYGELIPLQYLRAGDIIREGDVLGHLTPVLAKDKGRPRTMLHLEMYEPEMRSPIAAWELGSPKPAGIIDPMRAIQLCGS